MITYNSDIIQLNHYSLNFLNDKNSIATDLYNDLTIHFEWNREFLIKKTCTVNRHNYFISLIQIFITSDNNLLY